MVIEPILSNGGRELLPIEKPREEHLLDLACSGTMGVSLAYRSGSTKRPFVHWW